MVKTKLGQCKNAVEFEFYKTTNNHNHHSLFQVIQIKTSKSAIFGYAESYIPFTIVEMELDLVLSIYIKE